MGSGAQEGRGKRRVLVIQRKPWRTRSGNGIPLRALRPDWGELPLDEGLCGQRVSSVSGYHLLS